jgi:LPXTG-motif cell wall-anchored protein
VHCEHGRDDCAPVTTCSEPGDDCAPARTCSEPGDDCQSTSPEETTSEETQGQLPFTGANVLGIGGLGLLLSGGGLLLARRFRRDQM